MTEVRIGSFTVGDGHPPVFMAEVGTFFNQSLEQARSYARRIAAAGPVVFKTEILHDPEICMAGTGIQAAYAHAHGRRVEDYRQLIERKCNPLSFYADVAGLCRELKVPFVASVYDTVAVDFMVAQGGAALKIARNNVDHLPLIRHCAGSGLPIIFDAGGLYVWEIVRAVEEARRHGAAGVIVNHHPGANPTPAEQHNLAAIPAYKRLLDCPVGLSCHYRGEQMMYAAVALGANLIEKGVCDDPDEAEQDVVTAAPIGRLPDMLRTITECWQAIGCFPTLPREPRDLDTRSGLVARRDLRPGDVIDRENVGFAWPAVGIPVGSWDLAAGRRLGRAIAAGRPIDWHALEGPSA
ncbi:conserved hypothetical protein [Magnetospirillum sp. LM-5]|uniref:N-acetylneuraminate synthase family protein n=1 Tax=Magnetospirillum sp. LM-5 TaxID=2681466 RepID=UPI001380F704|nr:N-acetylneuraminate synthase family protein [Magnetospirillum sp. LM-5]CAA7622581.1 conserved hypothetical protein [Magnetospirillum sp. LM-5]